MRRHLLGLLVVLSSLVATAAPASAAPGSAVRDSDVDTDRGDSELPLVAGSRGGVEVFWWSAKGVESALPLVPFVQFELSPKVVLGFHVPISFVVNGHIRGEDKALLGLGNPTVDLTYVSTANQLTWYVGGRASLPLAGASDSRPWQQANVASAFAMTLYDLHYWAYKYLPVGVRAGLEYQLKNDVFFRGAFEPTLYIPIDSNEAGVVGGATRKTLFFYQLRVEMEGRADSGWGGGLGLQVFHALSEGDTFGRGDNAQGAIEPFLSYDSSTTFGRLGCLVALDTPLGLGFDRGKVAALHLTLGTHF
jgi:hypothetical protein